MRKSLLHQPDLLDHLTDPRVFLGSQALCRSLGLLFVSSVFLNISGPALRSLMKNRFLNDLGLTSSPLVAFKISLEFNENNSFLWVLSK